MFDWAFAGDGALGEDIGNCVPGSVIDLFVPAARLPGLAAAVYDAYLHGLRAGGWRGDERLVRLGVCASAVKYDWLTALCPPARARRSSSTTAAHGPCPPYCATGSAA
ncbi:hypothetical protein ACFSL4_11360 [Streptomyces caeni]|uniref:Uncharacterized protein n=1 Tax=Streptomyces caeni TaxID=2307231 RepID=A0ABW4IN95_9ACTN